MLKKTLQHPKANNKLRVEFVEKINRYQSQGRPIIYLDESGFITGVNAMVNLVVDYMEMKK